MTLIIIELKAFYFENKENLGKINIIYKTCLDFFSIFPSVLEKILPSKKGFK
jgi:hypothetical protein